MCNNTDDEGGSRGGGEAHVNHNPGRDAQRCGQELLVGEARAERECATNGGGQSRGDHERERESNISFRPLRAARRRV